MARARENHPLADLLGGRKDPAFERLAALAAAALGAPMAMVALIDGSHLHPLGRTGAPALARAGRTPLRETLCRHDEILVLDDAREHAPAKGLTVVKSGKALAYAGVPVRLAADDVTATLCVADVAPRRWTPDEVTMLEALAECVRTELAYRVLQRAHDRVLDVVRGAEEQASEPAHGAVGRAELDLGSAKALLRRLETAVDAAQSALATARADGAS